MSQVGFWFDFLLRMRHNVKSWWDLQYPSVLKELISFSHEGILLSKNGFDAIYVAHVCGTIEGAKIPSLV